LNFSANLCVLSVAQFGDAKLLQRTLEYAISPDVRSQDALGLIGNVLNNPAGEKLAWAFVQAHWDAVQKAGGPFASAQVVGATSSFCDVHMRDQGCGFLRCAQDRSGGTHLPPVDRAHQ
jgi:ERAP1-like C-terminal domain